MDAVVQRGASVNILAYKVILVFGIVMFFLAVMGIVLAFGGRR